MYKYVCLIKTDRPILSTLC